MTGHILIDNLSASDIDWSRKFLGNFLAGDESRIS